MNIIFFTHPTFLGSQSMPRFARFVSDGLRTRGHQIETWAPKAHFSNLQLSTSLKKWLGYIDQYIVFPAIVRKKIAKQPANTLYVFTDHALGPWVHLVKDKNHVIHCHDFLAQRSAIGEITENKTSWTGKKYQSYIQKGYKQGRNFISISHKTRDDLHRFLDQSPQLSEVIYNGVNPLFKPGLVTEARFSLGNKIGLDLSKGYLLHVGGNQWYKNRRGVIEIYEAWRQSNNSSLPLLMIGPKPNSQLINTHEKSSFKDDIYLISDLEDNDVRLAYQGASVFLFPSLAEGFGWPIAEAMASGCPVITTNETPMTEVAENAGFLITRRPSQDIEVKQWAKEAAKVVNQVLALSNEQHKEVVERGLINAQRFDADKALDQIERIYRSILTHSTHYESTSRN